MEEFEETISDPDYLKLKPYIREVVERTIRNLRPVVYDRQCRQKEISCSR